MNKGSFRRWSKQFGLPMLLSHRPYLEDVVVFLDTCGRLIRSGRMSEAGARSAQLIASSLVRGLYAVCGEEATDGDVVSWCVCGDLHGRMRLLEASLATFFKRRRSWRLPARGVGPVLIRGAEAARERLRQYDPAAMDKITSTDPIADMQAVLENVQWEVL